MSIFFCGPPSHRLTLDANQILKQPSLLLCVAAVGSNGFRRGTPRACFEIEQKSVACTVAGGSESRVCIGRLGPDGKVFALWYWSTVLDRAVCLGEKEHITWVMTFVLQLLLLMAQNCVNTHGPRSAGLLV